MIDFVATIQLESQRFGELLAADLRSDVPSCPEWTLADLAWHLTEVQYFWSNIAGRLLTDPSDTAILERPSDDAELPRLFAEHSAALLDAVTKRSPDDLCWSWDASGGTVAWVQRRQAHEALIHRVDAELAARALHAPIDEAIAADGVDEILTSMLSGVPDWGAFTPDGTTVRVDAADTGHRWQAEMGRFTGTSPSSGTSYDLDALELRAEAIANPTTVIAGAAADLDLWLWGRADIARLHVTGDPTTADRIRTMATESTQ